MITCVPHCDNMFHFLRCVLIVVPSHLPLRKPPNSDSDSSQESAPHEFMVSPPPPGGVTACPVAGAWESSEVGQKRGMNNDLQCDDNFFIDLM